MSYQKRVVAKAGTGRQVSRFAQENDVLSRCPDCSNMILERDIKHPCPHWPFRSFA